MGAASHVCDGGQVTDGHRHLWHTCAGRALLLTEPLEDTLFFLFLNWGTLKKKISFPYTVESPAHWPPFVPGRVAVEADTGGTRGPWLRAGGRSAGPWVPPRLGVTVRFEA